MVEWSYSSGKQYNDPFTEVELDVIFTTPAGNQQRVPAFWAGENTWRIRYASSQVGKHTYRTVSSDRDNTDLHGQEGVLEVTPYEGSNPLLRHGPLRVASNRHYLEHRDGTPFFWLADTWWMGLCKRLRWPHDFQLLTADRVSKGFTVIQIVAGLYPDMPAFDERGANEAGFPWTRGYSQINPGYFDMADLRIAWLVDNGLVPCIVGCWGYFLPWMGVDKMKQHWRNLVARYGAYPVVWCLAGEGAMPYYLADDKEAAARTQKQGWTELAAYVRHLDPYQHPLTIHPTDCAHNQVNDPSLLDIDMLQTGHGDRRSIPNTVKQVTASRNLDQRMPVIVGEACYEGIMEASRQEVQRFLFWASMLSGTAGHTYGANGIWQVNRRNQAFGASPHGTSWGNTPWEDAYRLPGSAHVGIGKQLLQRYPWWHFEPHPDWVEPHAGTENYFLPYAAGIPGKVRIIFMPGPTPPLVKDLEPSASYRAFYFDPKNAREYMLDNIAVDGAGNWQPANPPIFQDWVLVLENQETVPHEKER